MRATTMALAMATVLAGAGCRHRVTYVEPESNDGVVTVRGIDVQDWGMAAEKQINSLLRSGVLDRAETRPAVIMVSHIDNKTTEHIDTDMLSKKIRVALNRSGKAVTTTAVGVGGPEDEASMAVRDLRSSDEFRQDTLQPKRALVAPAYSLSGKIIEIATKAGRTRQSAFTFQLSLTDLKTGLAVWEDETAIVKKGKKAGVGW